MSVLSVIEYRAKARGCRQKASEAVIAGVQTIWLQTANQWDEMAETDEGEWLASSLVPRRRKHSKRNSN